MKHGRHWDRNGLWARTQRALARLPFDKRLAALRRLSSQGPRRRRRAANEPRTPMDSKTERNEQTKCNSCGCRMSFALNLDTGKTGPLDLQAPVYVVVRQVPVDPAKAPHPPAGWTARRFLERVSEIRMKDGAVLKPGDVQIHVSHFSTCPQARQHSRSAYQGKRS